MEDLDLYGRRSLRGLGPQDFASSLLIADVRKSIIEITARPPKPKEARPVVLPSIVPPRPPRQSKRVVLGRKRKSRAPWDPLKGGGREKPLLGPQRGPRSRSQRRAETQHRNKIASTLCHAELRHDSSVRRRRRCAPRPTPRPLPGTSRDPARPRGARALLRVPSFARAPIFNSASPGIPSATLS